MGQPVGAIRRLNRLQAASARRASGSFGSFEDRRRIKDLRTDMKRQRDGFEIGITMCTEQELVDLIGRHPKLRIASTGGDVLVSIG